MRFAGGRLWVGALVVVLLPVVQAASPVDVFYFENATQEQRYRALIEELRCPKCLNVNIAGSDAPIAQDLRAAVHRMVVEEQLSDAEILDFMQTRYGDFVLYDPPLNARMLWLWGLPVLVLLLAGVVVWRMQRRARALGATELDASDRARLQEILDPQPPEGHP